VLQIIILPFLLFQLLGKINNFVPTVEPELTRSIIDPILIALLTQQQQPASQSSSILFLPSPSQVSVISACGNHFSGILNNQPLSVFFESRFFCYI
jgi:hypothetical protein